MALQNFASDVALIEYADSFLRDHVRRFRKGIGICMIGQQVRGSFTHAYFPALTACIAFADLLSGLNCGKLNYPKLSDLQVYARDFMGTYDRQHLEILYFGFRHKLAHLAHPYAVFDTQKPKPSETLPPMKIAWSIIESDRTPAIELIRAPPNSRLINTRTPWTVPYDHRMKIRLKRFAEDIVDSVFSKTGYLESLKTSSVAREKFERCMVEYYPR